MIIYFHLKITNFGLLTYWIQLAFSQVVLNVKTCCKLPQDQISDKKCDQNECGK